MPHPSVVYICVDNILVVRSSFIYFVFCFQEHTSTLLGSWHYKGIQTTGCCISLSHVLLFCWPTCWPLSGVLTDTPDWPLNLINPPELWTPTFECSGKTDSFSSFGFNFSFNQSSSQKVGDHCRKGARPGHELSLNTVHTRESERRQKFKNREEGGARVGEDGRDRQARHGFPTMWVCSPPSCWRREETEAENTDFTSEQRGEGRRWSVSTCQFSTVVQLLRGPQAIKI